MNQHFIPDQRGTFTKEQIGTSIDLWRDGCTMHEIAEKLGIKWSEVKTLIGSRRNLFPYRKNNDRRADAIVLQDGMGNALVSGKRGCVVRTTITGAKITLPRVVFIDGPEPESEVA